MKKSKTRKLLVLGFIVLVALVAYISLRGQYLEFLEIGERYQAVFWQSNKYMGYTVLVNFIVLFLCIYITNKLIKKGLKKFFEEEKKELPKLPNKSIAFILSLLSSIVISQFLTQKIMLFLNTAWFGINDPIFNMDIGFYMFQKPFLTFILLYIIGIIVGLTIYTAIYYIIAFNTYFDGISRETLGKSTFLKQITMNLRIVAIFLAGLILVSTQNIVYEKMLSLNDKLQTSIIGAGLTDVTIKLWGYRLLAVIVVVSVFLGIKYFHKKQTKKVLFMVAVVPSYLVILFVVMLGFQLIFVKSNELDKQKKYISYHIDFTKNAYNLNIEEKNIENSGVITLDQINDNKNVIDNINIIDEDIINKTLEEKQTNSKYYVYNTNKIGLYNVDGKEKLLYVSPREITNVNSTYENRTYEYTHGYGVILSSATMADETGSIEYIQKAFDGSDQKINIKNPRIYYGLETEDTVITNSKNKTEYDYPISEKQNAEYVYEGTAGLQLGFLDRLILGIKKGDFGLAFSGEITKTSKILINRNIIQRAQKIMPYLMYDQEPYQVITEAGELVWVLDAYTVSNDYPYAQQSTLEINGTRQKINYIRNSVKVIIDSFDGTLKFYITDRTDPIIMAYRSIYPDLFVDLEEPIPEQIAKYMVYPKYLYDIQAEMLKRYHNVKTDVLYRSNDVWDIATHTPSRTLKTTGTIMDSYYTMVKTIDKNKEELGLIIPYTPYDKQNIISYLVGTYDQESNGKLKLYKFSADSNVLGPMQLDTQIEQDEEISKVVKALNVTRYKTY